MIGRNGWLSEVFLPLSVPSLNESIRPRYVSSEGQPGAAFGTVMVTVLRITGVLEVICPAKL